MRPELLAILPIAIAIVGTAACLVAWRRAWLQRVIAVTSLASIAIVAVGLVVAVVRGGPLTIAVGNWDAPVGIVFHADAFGAVMALVAAVIGLAVGVYAIADAPDTARHAGFWPLLLLLVTGVTGAFLTGDLFNLYVWFEVMLMASFVLLGIGGARAQLAASHVYLVLSMIGSTLFLIGCGLVYATTQTLDLGLIATRLVALAEMRPGLVLAIEALLLASFGLKAAVVPLMSWLPASYHTPLPSVSAAFAGLLTKVGVYAMIRLAADVFPHAAGVQDVLVVVAIVTMVVGVLGALSQGTVRRILGFHIVSQIGYMVAGLALATGSPHERQIALAAAVFYIVHHILVKANLFLIAGVVRRTRGTETLEELGGVARTHPYLAVLFLISAGSLAGIPPLSGFWAKLAVITAGISHGAVVVVTAAVAVGLLTLMSMLKIWNGVFAGPAPDGVRVVQVPRVMYAGITLLAAGTVAIGLAPGPLFDLAAQAAAQLGGGR